MNLWGGHLARPTQARRLLHVHNSNRIAIVGIPDVSVFRRGTEAVKPNLAMAALSEPLIVTVPTVEEMQERFLEIREVGAGTVVEMLSPKNKRSGAGKVKISIPNRDLYTTAASTLYILPHSRTGDVFDSNENRHNLRDGIPCFLLPLQAGDEEPIVNLQMVLEQVYQEAALDLAIAYDQQPVPPVRDDDFTWMQALIG